MAPAGPPTQATDIPGLGSCTSYPSTRTRLLCLELQCACIGAVQNPENFSGASDDAIDKMLIVLGYFLSSLDFTLWILTLGPIRSLIQLFKSKPKVVAMGNDPDAPRRRVIGTESLLETPHPDIKTIYDIMKRSAVTFANRPCFGTRNYLREGTADPSKGQRFPPKVFGDTTWITYKEAAARMEAFGRGLRHYGLQPQPDLKPGQSFDDLDGDFFLIVYENT